MDDNRCKPGATLFKIGNFKWDFEAEINKGSKTRLFLNGVPKKSLEISKRIGLRQTLYMLNKLNKVVKYKEDAKISNLQQIVDTTSDEKSKNNENILEQFKKAIESIIGKLENFIECVELPKKQKNKLFNKIKSDIKKYQKSENIYKKFKKFAEIIIDIDKIKNVLSKENILSETDKELFLELQKDIENLINKEFKNFVLKTRSELLTKLGDVFKSDKKIKHEYTLIGISNEGKLLFLDTWRVEGGKVIKGTIQLRESSLNKEKKNPWGFIESSNIEQKQISLIPPYEEIVLNVKGYYKFSENLEFNPIPPPIVFKYALEDAQFSKNFKNFAIWIEFKRNVYKDPKKRSKELLPTRVLYLENQKGVWKRPEWMKN